MSVLASIGTGNFTSSTTWGTVDATSYLNSETGSDVLTTAYSGTRSSAFTPGAITVSHIGVKLSVRTGTTGTISVSLRNSTLGLDDFVTGTEVTINCADLPAAVTADANGGWIFFKLATQVLLLAATAYNVQSKTSNATQISLFRDGTADNSSRALVTTTTAAPGAGDDLIVAGERTGAGTGNAFTVTMDETATTDYGAASTSLVTPSLAICQGGTLNYEATAATNYYLKQSGNVVVYASGTLNIGTTGTPIPRDSTAVLEFDPAADGAMGLVIRNLGTCNIQGLSRTSGKNITYCLLNTDEAVNSTSLGVDTDTGWLDNDEIVVAATTRTPTETEKGALNGNANASDMTVDGFAGSGGGLAFAHSGVGSLVDTTQGAEVILLTRNVNIRSATSTLMTYMDCKPTSTVDIDWARFRYVGDNTPTKRGVEVETTTGSFSMQYSTIDDCDNQAITINGASGSPTWSNNVVYNTRIAGANILPVSVAATSGTPVLDSNVVLGAVSPGGSQVGVVDLNDVGLTFTNNRVAGNSSNIAAGGVVKYNEDAMVGTHSGNVVHSNVGVGLGIVAYIGGTIGSWKVWRHSSNGVVQAQSSGTDTGRATINGLNAFGNTTTNVIAIAGNFALTLIDPVINSDATFSTTSGIGSAAGGYALFNIFNGSIGAAVAHTQDVLFNPSGGGEIYLWDTVLGSSTEVGTQTTNSAISLIRSQRHDDSGTTHKAWYRFGTITSDQTIRHTASGYSWKMTPNNASFSLVLPGPTEYGTFKAAVNASTAVTITGYVYKDSSYNGTAPCLVLVGGIIGGIASDVTDSLTVAHSNWEQLSVVATPNEAGVVEYYFDCNGTAGNVYVDDIAITQA